MLTIEVVPAAALLEGEGVVEHDVQADVMCRQQRHHLAVAGLHVVALVARNDDNRLGDAGAEWILGGKLDGLERVGGLVTHLHVLPALDALMTTATQHDDVMPLAIATEEATISKSTATCKYITGKGGNTPGRISACR